MSIWIHNHYQKNIHQCRVKEITDRYRFSNHYYEAETKSLSLRHRVIYPVPKGRFSTGWCFHPVPMCTNPIFFKLIETRQEAAHACDAASHKLHEICARAVDGIQTRNPLPRAYLSYHLITYTALETPITYSTDVG